MKKKIQLSCFPSGPEDCLSHTETQSVERGFMLDRLSSAGGQGLLIVSEHAKAA